MVVEAQVVVCVIGSWVHPGLTTAVASTYKVNLQIEGLSSLVSHTQPACELNIYTLLPLVLNIEKYTFDF